MRICLYPIGKSRKSGIGISFEEMLVRGLHIWDNDMQKTS